MPDSTIVVETSTSNFFSQKSTMTCSSACLAHLAVRGRDPRLGHDLAQPRRDPVDGLDPVVDVEDLALAQQLAADRGADLLLLVRADEGQHRVPLLGRGGDRRHLADAGQRHLQGARDRRRRHGQHVDVGAQLLQLLLVLDAEPLLLVDDDQAEVLELGLRREQPVGADDDVDGAVPQPLQDRLGLGVGLEPGQRPARSPGTGAYRSENVPKCCWTSSVVGTSTATCLPSCTALKAARTAISVLP